MELDKDLRQEIDDHQAIADSAVYATFSLSITGSLWLSYAVFAQFGISVIGHLPAPRTSCLISLISFLFGIIMYQVSIQSYGRFGELFKSVFDTKQDKIDLTGVIERVSELTKDTSLTSLGRKERFKTAWRYLQNYRIKCPKCGQVIPAPEIEKHRIKLHITPKAK